MKQLIKRLSQLTDKLLFVVVKTKDGVEMPVLDTPDNRKFYNVPDNSPVHTGYDNAVNVIKTTATIIALFISTTMFAQTSQPCNTENIYVTSGYVDSSIMRFVVFNVAKQDFAVTLSTFKANAVNWLSSLQAKNSFTYTGEYIIFTGVINDTFMYRKKVGTITFNATSRADVITSSVFIQELQAFLFCNKY